MAIIIDRRPTSKDKTSRNRQKFIARSRDQIKKAVKDQIDKANIADIQKGKVRVKVKGLSEPVFHNDPNKGNKRYILPGNKKNVVGDLHPKPVSGGSGRSGGLGQGEDAFEFELNDEETLNLIFEDLELPDLIKEQIKDITKTKPKRAGFTNQGNPAQLDIIRSLKNSIGRRIGLKRPRNEDIRALEDELKQISIFSDAEHHRRCLEIEAEILALKKRQRAVPWLDPFDVRYRNFINQPQPSTQAVMLCLMDVSGSMGQLEKDLAKRFFFFLYLFLGRKYEKVDVVFIRHHETAKEVDEEEFFHSRESGGTVVSSALELATKIIHERYPVDAWNIYVAQASDGDNFVNDEAEATAQAETLLQLVQYFAYVEVRQTVYMTAGPTSVWESYAKLSDFYPNLQTRVVQSVGDVWKVFRDLFKKEKP